MSIPEWAAALARHDPLVYAASINGRPFATQWTMWSDGGGEAGEAGDAVFQFCMELDPAVLGVGGSTIRQRSRLVADRGLRPIRYESETAGSRVVLEFAGDDVRVGLPDGSTLTVPAGGAEIVVESYVAGLDALFLALAHHRGRLGAPLSLTAFVFNNLAPVPITVEPAPELGAGWVKTSHGEDLLVDGEGVLQQTRISTQGFESHLLSPAPPVPDWLDAPTLAPPRLASYTPPRGASFRVEEAPVEAGDAVLGATLTIPAGDGPFPAVLFIGGSGVHDRHGLQGELDTGVHEVMDGLAQAGVAGLRYDSRGAGSTPLAQDSLEPSLALAVADARAALARLASSPHVDPARLFLIGHSEGGVVALRVAAEDDDRRVAGVVLLAAPGRGIDEVLRDQVVAQSQRLGLSDEQTALHVAHVDEFLALVEAGVPLEPGSVPDLLVGGARQRRWVEEHLASRATDLIARLRCPVLVCQGDRDPLVSVAGDAMPLAQAARAAGVPVDVEVLAGLDHFFKPAAGEQATPEEVYDPDRRVDPRLVQTLAAWITRA